MRRRHFLGLTAFGAAGLTLAPALARAALLGEKSPRVAFALGERWVDAAELPGTDAGLPVDSLRLSVQGLEGREPSGPIALEVGYPQADVIVWGHRGGRVPSAGRQTTHFVPWSGRSRLELFLSEGGVRSPIVLRADPGPGPKLRAGTYAIETKRQARLLVSVEEC